CASWRGCRTRRSRPPWIARWEPSVPEFSERVKPSTTACVKSSKAGSVARRNWMNEELDSQLSAMFDGELPVAECELLARRLSRDEQLKARWGRYAVIGASIRAERGVRLNADLARRVSSVITKDPNIAVRFVERQAARAASKWIRPVAGLGVAAGVAALSILWMRAQVPGETPELAQVIPAAPAAAIATSTEPDSY